MKYFLIEGDDIEWLEKAVNDKIAEGWKPCGGIACCVDRNTDFKEPYSIKYIQALTKE